MHHHILGAVEEDTVPRSAVTAAPPGFLVVGFHVLGHVVMNHIPHIRFVDTHAEGVGGHHHRGVVIEEFFLTPPPLVVTETGVIAGDRNTFFEQHLVEIVHFFAGGGIDNPRLIAVGPHIGKDKFFFVFAPQHLEAEVRPVKAGDIDSRVLQVQEAANIGFYFFRGGGGKRADHRPHRQGSDERADVAVTGAKVVAPLGYAMGFINRHHADRQFPERPLKRFRFQPLRRDIDQPVLA